MPIVAVIAALAAVVWAAIYARRGSLVVGCGLFLIVGYVVGYDFWNARIGPLPVTLDRLVLVGLVVAFVVQWRARGFKTYPLTSSDWVLGGLLLLLTASAAVSGAPEAVTAAGSKWGRLVTCFILPAALYWIARQTPITHRAWRGLLAGLVGLGVYLAVTAVAETAGWWSLVFPRYIADPTLGIHFGRARGPTLNAASMGLYLTACLWCAWILVGRVRRGWQLVLLATLPAMALGVMLTYTRSTWLGLAASGLVVLGLELPRRWRWPALAATVLAGMVVVAVGWSHLIGLEREGSASDSVHSVNQRASFAYVSWQMFKDRPILGVGWGRFYDRKLPYLSDRPQDLELESIRPLNHHNTLLGLLTETGMIGLAAFLALLAVWTRYAWSLVADVRLPRWVRSQGVLMLALVANYFSSAVFHDLTLVAQQEWLLMLFAGLTVGLVQQQREKGDGALCAARLSAVTPSLHKKSPVPFFSTANLFGMAISRLSMREAVDRVLGWCREPRGEACRYVVTPNVDHAVMFQRRADVRAAYAEASLVLADGAPIVWASRLLGKRLPERVAGSDLVPRLFDAAHRPLRVFLLGAAPGVADRAAERIGRQWPAVQIVGACSPPLGFEYDADENARILAAVAVASPDLLVVGLGAPKQELWVHRYHHQLQAKVVLCVGATIDFLAGHRRRSPRWMRQAGLEWLGRVLSEPRRLAGRYARDAWIFPRLVWRQWRGLYS